MPSLHLEPLESRNVLSPATLGVASGILRSTESYNNLVKSEFQQFLGRSPDATGLQGWTSQLQNGLSPENLEAAFVVSNEFFAKHGNNNAAWVDSLYQSLLGRSSDPAGLSHWLASLTAGVSRNQVALAFTTSQERQGLIIADDYARFLGRSADPSGLQFWLNYESQGHNRTDVAVQLLASDEFFANHDRSATTFIAGMYAAVLQRTPGVPEINFWLNAYVHAGSTTQSAFDIQLRFDGLSASQQQILGLAAARWEQIIIGDLPNGTYGGVAVDDLLIDIHTSAIDGAGDTLAESGSDTFRRGSGLPIHGSMTIDTADLNDLEATGQLYSVVLHEMAHVLGFGSIWQSLGLLSGAGTTNPRFVGAHATAEYNAIFKTNDTSVPVEGRPSPIGSRDSHWRESVFHNEIMTPYISKADNPISRVSVAQFADLGYTVDLNAADVYTP